jgi:hypothetical protein
LTLDDKCRRPERGEGARLCGCGEVICYVTPRARRRDECVGEMRRQPSSFISVLRAWATQWGLRDGVNGARRLRRADPHGASRGAARRCHRGVARSRHGLCADQRAALRGGKVPGYLEDEHGLASGGCRCASGLFASMTPLRQQARFSTPRGASSSSLAVPTANEPVRAAPPNGDVVSKEGCAVPAT